MEYQTIFDVSQSGYKYWWILLVEIIVIGVGILVERKNRNSRFRNPKKRPKYKKQEYFVWIGVICFLNFWIFLIPYLIYQFLKGDLLSGKCEITEGTVNGWVPQTADLGSKYERFDVNGIRFIYSFNSLLPGFNQTYVFGGPIRDGLQVRIHYLPNHAHEIAKLEVAK